MDIKLLIALVSPWLAFIVWFVKRVMDDRRARVRRAKERDNLVRALYAEIYFNTRDMLRFVEQSPDQGVLRKALEGNAQLVPHITDARHTEIYRSRISEVHGVADAALHQLVTFYGLLEKIRAQVEGVNLPSFRTLSVDGRLNAVDVIRRSAEDALVSGRDLMEQFRAEYARLELKPFEDSGEEAP